ncbi:two-component response regulator-like PRR1 isoform X2 [Zingiber officinale]|uniref:two-component response regulator-like PRR1 isoform X2 n=1 Tax=Zingiber officinale TaxID=94328 RepID=UPI001C4BA391|nr:two-component response regulator-like PRR1 isoform X2 [Zingiber officinale]
MGRERGEEEEEGRRRCLEEGVGVADAGRHHVLDRSKVRILLCDNDPKSSQDVLQLLCKCSYQVISVKSARRVIDVLNVQGSEIDIILAEVDLPMVKGFKMMKYIARNKELRHIPIIMMSAQDEISVVVKCLRLGAADYLVKPLRMNELLNLWTHMWRRRRMLNMREKDVFSHDFEMLLSDPSDANTNSTILISDDTDDQYMVMNPESKVLNNPECESNLSPIEATCKNSLDDVQSTLVDSDRAVLAGRLLSLPKKTQLKVGESSAFLSYVKSNAPNKTPNVGVDMNSAPSLAWISEEHSIEVGGTHGNSKLVPEGYTVGNGVETSRRICSMDFQTPLLNQSSSTEEPQLRNEGSDTSCIPTLYPFPFCYRGMVNQTMIPAPGQMFQGGFNDVQAHTAPPLLPQYNQYNVVPYMPLIQSFPCLPMGTNSQSSHSATQWSSMPSSSAPEVKSSRTERRAAALVKFRQKRKDRCFDKKIRYEKRKSLAERRPRVRGQFAKQVNNVDLNQNMFSGGDVDSEDDDEDGEPTSRDLDLVSSPEQNASD